MKNEIYEKIVNDWQKKPMKSVSDIDTALDNFRVLFAYNSNKIENPETSYHDTREIFANGKVVGYTGELRTLFEIQNQKLCYDFLREKIADKQPIDTNLILEIHQILMNGCYDTSRWEQGERPGQFKLNDYITGDNVGSDPESVAKDLEMLCSEINEAPTNKVPTVASYLHLKFESIHPFADGNGRVGRTLMNYYLMTHGYPPVVMYEEDKKTYYMALTVYDKTEDISGFEQFLIEQTIKTWEKNSKPTKTLAFFL